MKISKQICIAASFMLVAVAIGAFGAHAFKDLLVGKYLDTFTTGSRYHFYHALSLLLCALLNAHYKNVFYKSFLAFSLGIILFSFNCYLYSLLQIKLFALIVPLGGISFMVGWFLMILSASKLKDLK